MAEIKTNVMLYETLANNLSKLNTIMVTTTSLMNKMTLAFDNTSKKMNSLDKCAANATSSLKGITNIKLSKELNKLEESSNKAVAGLGKLSQLDINEKLIMLEESSKKAATGLTTLSNINVSNKIDSIKDSSATAATGIKKLFNLDIIKKIKSVSAGVIMTALGFKKLSIPGLAPSKKLEGVEKSASKASNKVTKLAKDIRALGENKYIKKGMDFVDSYTIANEKLKLVNGGLKVSTDLQDKVFAAASRSRGAYTDMANTVSSINSVAAGSFGSTDELIAFAELLQKGVKIGGTSSDQQKSSMSQLTEAMGTGTLGEDAFKSLISAAPGIAKAISLYTGKSNEELKKMASQGAITASVLKNAMFASSGEINQNFNDMPMTFADIWNRIKESASHSVMGIAEKISELINSDGFVQFLDGIGIAFDYIGKAASWVIDSIIERWDTIGPILAYIGGVLLVAMVVHIWSIALAWLASIWPILLFVAFILLVMAVARKLGVTWEQITTVIGAAIGILAAHFYNDFVRIWNSVAAFINFFGNVFKDPVAAIQVLFYDLMINVLGFIGNMAQGIEDVINKIPGVEIDITSGIKGFQDKFTKQAAKIKAESEWEEFVKTKEFMDYSDAAKKGGDTSKKVTTHISDSLNGLKDILPIPDADPFKDLGTSNNPIAVTSADGNEVNISDEDLKYLRDIAERDYINKLSTATLAPNISVSFGDVHETADADKVAKRVQAIMQEEIAMMSEGVYAYG